METVERRASSFVSKGYRRFYKGVCREFIGLFEGELNGWRNGDRGVTNTEPTSPRANRFEVSDFSPYPNFTPDSSFLQLSPPIIAAMLSPISDRGPVKGERRCSVPIQRFATTPPVFSGSQDPLLTLWESCTP